MILQLLAYAMLHGELVPKDGTANLPLEEGWVIRCYASKDSEGGLKYTYFIGYRGAVVAEGLESNFKMLQAKSLEAFIDLKETEDISRIELSIEWVWVS